MSLSACSLILCSRLDILTLFDIHYRFHDGLVVHFWYSAIRCYRHILVRLRYWYCDDE